MTSKPLVSVITPTYNHEETIRECIQSVLDQTYQNWEQIVIDDGSTDKTGDIVRSFTDKRVKYLYQENKGKFRLDETYNRALGTAEGSLVCILEGDDLWVPRKLEVQVPDFSLGEVALSAGKMQSFVGDKYLGIHPDKIIEQEILLNRPVGRAAYGMMTPSILTFAFPLTVMMNRELLIRSGSFKTCPGLPLVDFPTLLNMTLAGPWVFHDEILGYWRRHEQSITKNSFPIILEGVYTYAHEFLMKFREELPISSEELRRLDVQWQDFQMRRAVNLLRLQARAGRISDALKVMEKARSYRVSKKAQCGLKLAEILIKAQLSPELVFRAARFPELEKENVTGVDHWVNENDEASSLGNYRMNEFDRS